MDCPRRLLEAGRLEARSLAAVTYIARLVAAGFGEVRALFERNFAERGEIGAVVAAYRKGDKVVDLWGGRRTPEGDSPWNEDTMVVVMSTTKGVSAMTLAVANARGWLDYDAPVASSRSASCAPVPRCSSARARARSARRVWADRSRSPIPTRGWAMPT
jgi:hypothetical protein